MSCSENKIDIWESSTEYYKALTKKLGIEATFRLNGIITTTIFFESEEDKALVLLYDDANERLEEFEKALIDMYNNITIRSKD